MKQGLLTFVFVVAAGVALAQGAGGHGNGKHDNPQHKTVSFDELDANHDGKITRDEFREAEEKMAQKMFAKLDLNRDGQIDRAEFDKAHKLFTAENSEINQRERRLTPVFTNLDKDGTGSISHDEFINATLGLAMKRFDRLDTDGDGVITRDELETSIKALGGMHDAGALVRPRAAGNSKPPEPPADSNKPIVSDK